MSSKSLDINIDCHVVKSLLIKAKDFIVIDLQNCLKVYVIIGAL